VAPSGTHLISRYRVDSWVVARFSLDRPRRLDVRQLIASSPRFFLHFPESLLIFFQEPGR
jgi:hypothetical protein